MRLGSPLIDRVVAYHCRRPYHLDIRAEPYKTDLRKPLAPVFRCLEFQPGLPLAKSMDP